MGAHLRHERNAKGIGRAATAARCSAALVILGACGGPSGLRDAAVPDSSAPCGELLRFTGEYIDWDSGAPFCAIAGATFQLQGSAASSITDHNGRFELCIPDEATVAVDITPSPATSSCTKPPQQYKLPGVAIANRDVIAAGGAWSGRAFGSMRHTVDPTRAQVVVHVNGAPRRVSLSAPHTMTQVRINDAWTIGDTGSEVFFIDIEVGDGFATLSADNAIGTGVIPLYAGKLTSVSIIAQ